MACQVPIRGVTPGMDATSVSAHRAYLVLGPGEIDTGLDRGNWRIHCVYGSRPISFARCFDSDTVQDTKIPHQRLVGSIAVVLPTIQPLFPSSLSLDWTPHL